MFDTIRPFVVTPRNSPSPTSPDSPNPAIDRWQEGFRRQQDAFRESLDGTAVQATLERPNVVKTLRALYKYGTYPFYCHAKPLTIGCEEAALYRYNSVTDSLGVPLRHEVKTLVRSSTDKNGVITLHVFVTPATYQLSKKATKGSSVFDLERIGLVAYTINPIMVLKLLLNKAELQPELQNARVVFYYNTDFDQPDLTFVTNNLADRELSGTFNKDDYFATVAQIFAKNTDGWTWVRDDVNPKKNAREYFVEAVEV